MYFDDTEEELLVTAGIGGELRGALSSELIGEGGDGGNTTKREPVQDHPVTSTHFPASDISPGGTSHLSKADENKREVYYDGWSNANAGPEAEGDKINSIHNTPINCETFNNSVLPTEQKMDGRNEENARKSPRLRAKDDLTLENGRGEETVGTNMSVSVESEVVNSQRSPTKIPGESYNFSAPAKRKTENFTECKGHKNRKLNVKSHEIYASHIPPTQADGFDSSDGKRIDGGRLRTDTHFHCEGDAVHPIDVAKEHNYSGNYRILPAGIKGMDRKNALGGDSYSFQGNGNVINPRDTSQERVYDSEYCDMRSKKKIMCCDMKMGCKDALCRGEGNVSKPSVLVNANSYPYMFSEDNRQEWDSKIDSERPHRDIEGDVMKTSNVPSQRSPEKKTGDRNKLIGFNHAHNRGEGDLSKQNYIPPESVEANSYHNVVTEDNTQEWDNSLKCENQYQHTEADLINENYIPSQQTFDHTFEPPQQMDCRTNKMGRENPHLHTEVDDRNENYIKSQQKRAFYTPSESVKANRYRYVSAEDNRQEWDYSMYSENPYHHTKADLMNENYIPSQQTFDHTFEPPQHMDCRTHTMGRSSYLYPHLHTEGDDRNENYIKSQQNRAYNVPSECVDANSYPYVLAEDNRQDWGYSMCSENLYHHTEADLINEKCIPSRQTFDHTFEPPQQMDCRTHRMGRSSYLCPHLHTEGDDGNENYSKSQQNRAFYRPFEPAEQMDYCCTHGMDERNKSVQAEYDIRHPCQHGPSEEWEPENGAMTGDTFAADPPAPRRTEEKLGMSEGPLDYLLVLVYRAWEGEVIGEVEILLDLVYENMREEPENDQLWEQPQPVIREELLLRLRHMIINAMRRQQYGVYDKQKMATSRQYSDRSSPRCKCSSHPNYQMHSTLNTNRMDYGNAWGGEERRHNSHTRCRQHNVSSTEERDQYHRRTGYLGGMVAGENRGEERRIASDVAADVHALFKYSG